MALSAICLLTFSSVQAQVIESATGTTAASITPARDAFRADIGGGNVAGANGSFGGVRREINWDAVPPGFSAPNSLPANFFNANSPRGAVFSTPGSGFEVSGASTDNGAGQPAPANFGNINPSYTATFAQFSPQRLFTSLGSNVMTVSFFLPGTNTPATVSAFGAVFCDVDLTNTTSIQLFNSANVSLGIFFVPATAGTATFSFLGISFSQPIIASVRITSGNAALGLHVNDGNGTGTDVVVMDDFIYSEPVPEPATISLLGLGVLAAVALRVRRRM
jgi:hypothetical protein